MKLTRQGVRDLNTIGPKRPDRRVPAHKMAEAFCRHSWECVYVQGRYYRDSHYIDRCRHCGVTDACQHEASFDDCFPWYY